MFKRFVESYYKEKSPVVPATPIAGFAYGIAFDFRVAYFCDFCVFDRETVIPFSGEKKVYKDARFVTLGKCISLKTAATSGGDFSFYFVVVEFYFIVARRCFFCIFENAEW